MVAREDDDEYEQLYNGLDRDTVTTMTRSSEKLLTTFLQEPLPERKKWFLIKVSRELGAIAPEDIDTAAAILEARSGNLLQADDARPRLTQAVVINQRNSAIERMNARYFVIRNEGGKCLVGQWNQSETGAAITWQAPREFAMAYASEKVFAGHNANGPILKPIGKFWFEHADRIEYDELGFNPNEGLSYEENGVKRLNLWRGWNISFNGLVSADGKSLENEMVLMPMRGRVGKQAELTGEKWPNLKYHIETVLAGGDPVAALYIMKWAAYAFQNVDKPAGVALCFRGVQGTGKGTFGTMMLEIFGKTARHITKENDISGRFNGLYRGVCLAFFDEAIYPKARAAQAALKGMLTEQTLMFESKGRDQLTDKNRMKVVLATNNDWVVPVEVGDRRFAVFDVADIHKVDRPYFAALKKALYQEGEAAQFLYECLHLDLGDWHPEVDIPETKARREQKANALGDEQRLVHELLHLGEVVHHFPKIRGESGDVPWWPSSELVALCERYKVRHDSKTLASALKALGFRSQRASFSIDDDEKKVQHRAYTGNGGGKKVRHRGYVLPSLSEARRLWGEMGYPNDFEDADEPSPQDEKDDISRGWTIPMERPF